MASENAKSDKVLSDLVQKLTLSTDAADIKASSGAIATFINGDIQDLDVPSK